MVLAKGIRNQESFLKKLPMITARVGHTIRQSGEERRVTTSLGVSLFPDHGSTWEELYRHADRALYFTKEVKGKNGVSTYAEVLERGDMEE